MAVLGSLTLISFFRPALFGFLPNLTLPVLLLVPLVWSTTPMWRGGDVILPYAGPNLIYWGGAGNGLIKYQSLADYLQTQRGDEAFLIATENAVVAAPLELLTKQPVMAMGGFTGADPILTVDKLAELIANGQVRFFLVEHREPIDSEKVQWIVENCSLLSIEATPENMDLYDCRVEK